MQAKKGHWLSENQSKASGEKFFLIYTLVWIVLMGIGIVLGLPEKLNDAGMIVMAAVISVPIVLVPIFFMREPGKKWYQTYCFKANLFIFILSFFQNYVLTHYFFDVLGMVYSYPTVTSHLEATLIGKSGQPVPLIMYFYPQCFYMTYHVTAIVVLRRLCTIDKPVIQKLRPVRAGWPDFLPQSSIRPLSYRTEHRGLAMVQIRSAAAVAAYLCHASVDDVLRPGMGNPRQRQPYP